MMSTPTQPARKPSAAGRYLFVLLLGLIIGAVCTVMLLRALDARRDHFPESLMHVQQWHMNQLKAAVEGNRCAATDVLPHLQALRALGNDMEPGFPDLADDRRFKDHASKYRGALDAALANPPLNCAGAGTTLQDLGQACKACHQDFRS
jgi:hypothetical protein